MIMSKIKKCKPPQARGIRRKNRHTAVRKGFVQVIEVAIAALLIVLVLPTFFSWINVKQDWARHDLIVSGIGVFHSLEASGNLSQIFNNTQEIIREMDFVKPANVKYSIYSEGMPKTTISLACISCTDAQLYYAKNVFSPALFNGMFLNFSIEKFDLSAMPSIPGNYDVAVFINYTDANWTSQKQKISDYLAGGDGIIAMQKASNGIDFMNLFNLTENPVGSASYQNFSSYYPAGSNIGKYFLAFGFDISTVNDGTGIYRGTWYIWETSKQINTTGAAVEILGVGTKTEGQTFTMTGPDGKTYSFRVKKIWPDRNGVIIQALDKGFVFKNFWETGESKVRGNNILIGDQASTYSLMTKNNSAIWISDFPNSDEYRILAKAAAESVSEKYYLVKPVNVKSSANVNAFINTCCDAPTTSKLTFTFWYVY